MIVVILYRRQHILHKYALPVGLVLQVFLFLLAIQIHLCLLIVLLVLLVPVVLVVQLVLFHLYPQLLRSVL